MFRSIFLDYVFIFWHHSFTFFLSPIITNRAFLHLQQIKCLPCHADKHVRDVATFPSRCEHFCNILWNLAPNLSNLFVGSISLWQRPKDISNFFLHWAKSLVKVLLVFFSNKRDFIFKFISVLQIRFPGTGNSGNVCSSISLSGMKQFIYDKAYFARESSMLHELIFFFVISNLSPIFTLFFLDGFWWSLLTALLLSSGFGPWYWSDWVLLSSYWSWFWSLVRVNVSFFFLVGHSREQVWKADLRFFS